MLHIDRNNDGIYWPIFWLPFPHAMFVSLVELILLHALEYALYSYN